MSLPPSVIHVKRKRTEEGPVPSFLKIESATKRHRSDAFLYRRHDPGAAAALAAKRAAAEAEARNNLLGSRSARPPTIHPSQPGDEKRKRNTPTTPTKSHPTILEPDPSPAVRPIAEPRRFHLSRQSLMAAHAAAAAGLGVGSAPLPGMGVGAGMSGVRKRTRYAAGGHNPAEPAVFVERSKKKHRTRTRKHSGSTSGSGTGKAVLDDKVTLPSVTAWDSSATPGATLAPLPKRPGRRLATKSSNLSTFTLDGSADVTDPTNSNAAPETDVSAMVATTTTTRITPALPPSLSNRQWNTDMEQLTRDMNDYTLEIIGRNLAQMGETALASDAKREAERERGEMSRLANERRKAAYSKYKPKPGARYAERHAERQEGGAGDDEMDNDSGSGSGSGSSSSSETDEDDYVTETYVRIPGHEAAKAQAAAEGGASLVPATIGLLVFDNEPDLEFFYGVEEDSEDDFEDDEDENAENYYAHDYPEDEVSSDDEFDRDAYHYRNGNASDLEEFGEGSDAEQDARYASGGGNLGMIGVPAHVRLTKPGDL